MEEEKDDFGVMADEETGIMVSVFAQIGKALNRIQTEEEEPKYQRLLDAKPHGYQLRRLWTGRASLTDKVNPGRRASQCPVCFSNKQA
jgi:hypothetical protein